MERKSKPGFLGKAGFFSGRGGRGLLEEGSIGRRRGSKDIPGWGSFVLLTQIPGLESVGPSAATLGVMMLTLTPRYESFRGSDT